MYISVTVTPFFCTLIFAKSRIPNFLKFPDPKKISGRPDELEQWVQIDWANELFKNLLKMLKGSD